MLLSVNLINTVGWKTHHQFRRIWQLLRRHYRIAGKRWSSNSHSVNNKQHINAIKTTTDETLKGLAMAGLTSQLIRTCLQKVFLGVWIILIFLTHITITPAQWKGLCGCCCSSRWRIEFPQSVDALWLFRPQYKYVPREKTLVFLESDHGKKLVMLETEVERAINQSQCKTVWHSFKKSHLPLCVCSQEFNDSSCRFHWILMSLFPLLPTRHLVGSMALSKKMKNLAKRMYIRQTFLQGTITAYI